jgi:hypothetical protein
MYRLTATLTLAVFMLMLAGCSPTTGSELVRRGDEIVVAGRMFHTGASVVLWTDPGGYDAYRTEKRFVPWPRAAFSGGDKNVGTPNRLGLRFAPRPPFKDDTDLDFSPLTPDEFERVRGGGWDLDLLRRHIDQFVLHYDVCGVSRQCFRVLHDLRGLSIHFMIDIDGTIYQTMDAKERAWHATISNDRSVGVEIANMGAYARDEKHPLNDWYEPDPPAWDDPAASFGASSTRAMPDTVITIPPRLGDGGVRRPGTHRPAWPLPLYGPIHGRELRQYDLTDAQYDALIRLTAALHKALPRIALDYPRDERGLLETTALSRQRWEAFSGVIGHHHIQKDKSDPGPALDWDRVINGARRHLGMRPLTPGGAHARYAAPSIPSGSAASQPEITPSMP